MLMRLPEVPTSELLWRLSERILLKCFLSIGNLSILLIRVQFSSVYFRFHFDALEKEMATHSSVLAWRIPGTGEPGGLLSLGSHSQT